MKNTLYYLTGMGGRLVTGLGQGLLDRGLTLQGRELFGDFKQLRFQQQIDLVAQDLSEHFWHPDARVIANSFGAYLFLHAQAQLPPYVGQVVLLSPIVGEFGNEESRLNFIPPRAERLFELAQAGRYPAPQNCQIHVGAQDWQSQPRQVLALGALLKIAVTVVPHAGHMLPKDYVGDLLDQWLLQPALPNALP